MAKIILRVILLLSALFLSCFSLEARIISVPRDSLTIQRAVAIARDGDTILVEPGFYFEENIVLNRSIRLFSQIPFAAIIYGTGRRGSVNAIFIVQAQVRLEGFILKSSQVGILQRFSPDVAWEAENLIIENMALAGVSINDVKDNVGQARLRHVFISSCGIGVETNDAHSVKVEDSLIVACRDAFRGHNHLSFKVSQTLIVAFDGPPGGNPSPERVETGAPISFGPGVRFLIPLIGEVKQFWQSLYGFISSRLMTGKEPVLNTSWKAIAFRVAGDAWLHHNDLSTAWLYFRRFHDLGESLKSKEIQMEAFGRLGELEKKQGHWEEARKYFRSMISVAEEIRKRYLFGGFAPGFSSEKWPVYESLMAILFELDKKYPHRGYSWEAFELAESLKARGFLDELGLKLGHPDESFSREISRLQIRLRRGEVTPEQKPLILKQLTEAEAGYYTWLVQRQREVLVMNPGAREPLKNVTQLDQETAILEFFLGERESFAFNLRGGNLRAYRLAGANIIRPLVDSYLKVLQATRSTPGAEVEGARKLAEVLFPFRDWLKGIRRLVIIPDDCLHFLPFESLPSFQDIPPGERGKKGQSGRYLIEDVEIIYAPSLRVFDILNRKEKGEARSMDLLAVAPQAKAFDLPPLRHNLQEVQRIARLFPSKRTTVISGEEASEDRLKLLPLRNYRFIHLATHAVIDEDRWWRSALILHEGKNESEDGLLQPRDLFHLELEAEVVTLSACTSGGGRLERGEGVRGLFRAFLRAGAKAVLVSLWDVADDSTARFMEAYYCFLARNVPPARALQLAKSQFIRNFPVAEWASFILVGTEDRFIR